MAQPQPLATSTTPLSVSMHVTALGMSWKWNHEVFVSCDLHFSLPVVSSGLIHAVMSVRTSFLRPNNSPLSVHVSGVSIQPLIHWLSCFTSWLLWMVLLWVWVYRSLCGPLSFLLDVYPVELLGPMLVVLCLLCGRTTIPLSSATVPGSQLLHTLSRTYCSCFCLVF